MIHFAHIDRYDAPMGVVSLRASNDRHFPQFWPGEPPELLDKPARQDTVGSGTH